MILAGISLVGCATDRFMNSFHKACSIEYKAEEVPNDYWQTPKETKKLKTGDCEDKAFYLQDLLKKEGIKTREVFGMRTLSDRQMHSWLEYELKGKTYIVDPTFGFIGKKDTKPMTVYVEIKHKFFDMEKKKYQARLKKGE